MSLQIHRLRVEMPIKLAHLNAYLIEGARGYALVDTGLGLPMCERALERELAAHGLGIEAIERLFVTHFHGDHWGLAARLQRRGTRVVLPRVEAELLRRWFEHPEYDADSVEIYRGHGVPEAVLATARRALGEMRALAPRFEIDETVEDGETVELAGERFEAIVTPGHSPGHACLHHTESRTLLVGDHVLPHITPNVSVIHRVSEDPLTDYRRSLEKVRGRGFSVALPAHGDPIPDLDRRIGELLDHHEQRETLLCGLLAAGPKTTYELAEGLFALASLDSWETWMALGETLAHIRAAVGRGRLRSRIEDGTERFERG
jgi:glyoxylase-like metal-dependent hydrolase (beta-lactamase superfamily II)